MTWLISEILLWLAAAGVIGLAGGWFLRASVPDPPPPPEALPGPQPERVQDRIDPQPVDINAEIARLEMELRRLERKRERGDTHTAS